MMSLHKVPRWLGLWLVVLYSLVGGLLEVPHAAQKSWGEQSILSGQLAALSGPPLTLSTNSDRFQPGDPMTLSATVVPGDYPWPVDVYVALQQPDQTLLFLQANGSFTLEARPLVAGWTATPFAGEIFHYTFSGGEMGGNYVWLAAFSISGTSQLITDIAQAPFTLEAPIFEDNFDDGLANDWIILSGLWAVRDGEFVESSDVASHNIALHGPSVVDFQLTAQLRSTDDDNLGLVFRFRDGNNFYLVTAELRQ